MLPVSNFAEVNEYLRRFHDPLHAKYSLDNMRALMGYLGNPQDKFIAVHVAGTSGKTSTAYYMSALLTAGGQKTGLTVSPHVDELNERVQINGQPLEEAEFCKALSEFLKIAEETPIKPSWFEVVVAFAYWYFAHIKVDYAVVEVGLGGLKDATNVITRADKVCVITDIGFDHMKVLGNTLGEIARQKAGIIQPGNVVFSYRQPPEVMAVLEKAAAQNMHVVTEQVNPHANVPDYQFRNGYLAYRVYRYLQERDDLAALTKRQFELISTLVVPGRMDAWQVKGKTVVMDGAHNAQKMVAFVASFKKLYPGVKPAMLLALREGKEYEAVAPILAELASRVITTTFETTQDLPIKSLPAEELAVAFQGLAPATAIPDYTEAYENLLSGPEEICVVTGSIYLLGQIRNNELI